jgi:hypothetical protein
MSIRPEEYHSSEVFAHRVLLETSQVGLAYALGPHQLQPAEARVRHFHQTYREAMDAA